MWNYRVVETDTKPEPTRELRLVYYIDGNPIYWSSQAAVVMWSAGENPREIVDKLIGAFRLPIIKEEDINYEDAPF